MEDIEKQGYNKQKKKENEKKAKKTYLSNCQSIVD